MPFPRATAATDLRASLILAGALQRCVAGTEGERVLRAITKRLWKVLVMLEPQRAKVLERSK